MTDWSHRTTARNLCCFLFACSGSIWRSVFPYCLLNCGIMALVEWLAMNHFRIAFPIQGHTLMTLLISYLVVAKINLSYERYMRARHASGNALSSLRELNQLALSYTYGRDRQSGTPEGEKIQPKQEMATHQWRVELTNRIVDLMECTIRILRDEKQSQYLARNEFESTSMRNRSTSKVRPFEDPLVHVQALRMHLYQQAPKGSFQVLERIKLMDMLDDYVSQYRQLLTLASTPLPFPLVQMARTFLFLWTFTIPFVLRGITEEALVAMLFVFFLTYGFIGLELVSLQLVHPFGDGKNDLNITGMKEATLRGMERDLEMFGEPTSLLGDKRADYVRQQIRRPRPIGFFDSDRSSSTSSEASSTTTVDKTEKSKTLLAMSDNCEGGDHHPTDHMYVALGDV